MSAPFEPGDVVVCVDAAFHKGDGVWDAEYREALALLSLKKPYRIEALSVLGGLHLAGVHSYLRDVWDRGYAPDRFRKIDDDVTEEFREQIRALGKQRERVS